MRIRTAIAGDASAVRAIYVPIVESTAISFEVSVPSEDEMAARIAGRQPTYPWLIAEGEWGVEGYAYAGRFSARSAYDWSVETSVYVDERARGHGVGRALYRALLAVLAAQGYRQAMAGIALPNQASVGLHERCGFAPVGVYKAVGWKFGAWHDVGWWQRPIATSDGAPRPPTPIDSLPAGALAAALATTTSGDEAP
jgi:L-amino acid N-acyltransferase YncA